MYMRRDLLLLGVAVVLAGMPLLAHAASSASYEVIDALNAAGGRATSAQYDVTDSLSPLDNPGFTPSTASQSEPGTASECIDCGTFLPEESETVSTGSGGTAPGTTDPTADDPGVADTETPSPETVGEALWAGIVAGATAVVEGVGALIDALVAALATVAAVPAAASTSQVLALALAVLSVGLAMVPVSTGIGVGLSLASGGIAGLAVTASQVAVASSLPSAAQGLLFGWRRKRRGYGRVYDLATKQPVVGATVRLLTHNVVGFSPGKLVGTVRTGAAGEYRFHARPGEYRLEVVAADHHFPSRYAAVDYRGELLTVGADGGVVVDIPLDGDNPRTWLRVVAIQRLGQWLTRLRLPVLVVGSVLAVAFAVTRGTALDSLVVVLYSGIWALELRRRMAGPHNGQIWADGKPVRLAVVRVFGEAGRLIATRVTDRAGMVSAFLSEGTYEVAVTTAEFGTYRQQLRQAVSGPLGFALRVDPPSLRPAPAWQPAPVRSL